jgi:dihydrofolate reductase
MRKIIAGFAISIDGFMEGPNGEIDWIVNDSEHFKEYSKQWKEIDTMLYGRKTYEAVVKYQANSKSKSNPFAHMKHIVFSKTLQKADAPFILQNGNIEDEVGVIRSQPGKNIAVFGGAQLLSTMINLKLLNELVLVISPVILGNGKPCFINIQGRNYFELKQSKSYKSGLVVMTYELKS